MEGLINIKSFFKKITLKVIKKERKLNFSDYKTLKEALKKEVRTVIRFLTGGLVAGGLYYVVFIPLIKLGVWYIYSSLAAFIVNYLVGFLIHKYWTFKNNNKKEALKQSRQYFVLKAGTVIANSLILILSIEIFKLQEIQSQLLATMLITVVNFLVTRKIFKQITPQ